ncbi:MAG TPA: sugar ABC transporter ATP-binding protein, partial [Candidatus Sulfotelmatobacter sp.]|nr:sugar ABC transporter ATP-binding protein [Candidatus Sulfotelmatobacter sp.]
MPLLEIRGLTKGFPGVTALADVTIDADAGEVHAIVGANGAGKSTLMNILAGVFAPSAGTIRLAGVPFAAASPRQARDQGISIVYQELTVLPRLTVAENVYLGREPVTAYGLLDARRLRNDTQALLQRFGLALRADAMVGDLSVAQQQLVELARALSFDAKVVIFDEPTAVLSLVEQRRLFDTIDGLRKSGILVLYVSHRLEEIFAIADRVSVLRDGHRIATTPITAIDRAELVRQMIGHGERERYVVPAVPSAEPLLRARYGIGAERHELLLRHGEVLGLAGLVGAGRTRLARGLAGLGADPSLRVEVAGKPVRGGDARAARRHGIVYLTENRKRDGLFGNLSVLANTTAADLRRFSRFGVLTRRQERAAAGGVLAQVRLVAASLTTPVSRLSGGNQQKVIVSRALICRPRILICDEPTRGVDVGAKEEIYDILLRLAAEGVGIILISSEWKELLAVCHRLLVMRDSAIVGECGA